MKYEYTFPYKERIGVPELFTGRKKELEFLLNWIDEIKREGSKSTAILARRKNGKTAIMERLFNITFNKNNGVIPFYYEIKEHKMWVVDFCEEFFLTFIYQYIAFKSRKPEYLEPQKISLENALALAQQEGLHYLTGLIEDITDKVNRERVDLLWEAVRQAPKRLAANQNEFIVQMIDEFQFMNARICLDKEKKNVIGDLAGGYLSTAESKVAPLLVSGSWVGWLMRELWMTLPGRFKYYFLKDMPEDEAVEMIYKYSQYFSVPVTEETAYLLAKMAEGSPFYISCVMRSVCPEKDLSTIKGLMDALEFETLDDQGEIKATWMEYVASAFPRINDLNAKNIVLHLCKNRDRELTRAEIMKDLNLDMTDGELELKLKALVKTDIILQGRSNFNYRGVKDNIFDKVFRGVYEEEIARFDPAIVIKKEYNDSFQKLKRQYRRLQGKFNYQKGYFAEYLILDRLRMHAKRDNEFLKSITRYLPIDFNFASYSRVWRYDYSPVFGKRFNIDIFAVAENPGEYSIIGEVKNRDIHPFSKEEAIAFSNKMDELKKLENLEKSIGFVFSRSGFTEEAEAYCRENGIAITSDEQWLG